MQLPEPDDYTTLVNINRADLIMALGWAHVPAIQPLLNWLCTLPARRLADQVVMYDQLVGSAGMQVGSAWMLGQYVQQFDIVGPAQLPTQGPLLIVANHPGLADTLLLMAAIPRTDVRIIAAERPFLRALPNTAAHLITVSDEPVSRQAAARRAVRHLRAGGTLLTFPGGRIEPDPAVLPGASEALALWEARITVFLRRVPDLVVVPAIVSGVLSVRALRHPLTYLRRSAAGRQLLAAALQLVFPALRNNRPRLVFGTPLRVAADSSESVAQALLAEVVRLMRNAEKAHVSR